MRLHPGLKLLLCEIGGLVCLIAEPSFPFDSTAQSLFILFDALSWSMIFLVWYLHDTPRMKE